MIKSNYKIEYSEEKNLILIEVRKISFEEVIMAIENGDLLDDIDHFNKVRYKNQRIFIVKIRRYIYAVPYVIDSKRSVIFLKTIYPSRQLNKKYLKNEK